MTKDQCKSILMALTAYWDKEDMNDLKREFYFQSLKDYSYLEVKDAIRDHVKRSRFFPKVADIIIIIDELREYPIENPMQIEAAKKQMTNGISKEWISRIQGMLKNVKDIDKDGREYAE